MNLKMNRFIFVILHFKPQSSQVRLKKGAKHKMPLPVQTTPSSKNRYEYFELTDYSVAFHPKSTPP